MNESEMNRGAAHMFRAMKMSAPDLTCPCFNCYEDAKQAALDADPDLDPFLSFPSVMHCCAICGNKRCPHGTNHNLDCTGSNEYGYGRLGTLYTDSQSFLDSLE